jgi:DNA replication protein DnaC
VRLRGGWHTDEQHVVVGRRAGAGRGDVGGIVALDRAAGYLVRDTLAAELASELAGAADGKQLTTTIARYGRAGLLCIDEPGYMEPGRRGAELLFQVLTEREEKASVAIGSNDSFSPR